MTSIEESRQKFKLPTSADLNGAAVALVRLQELYNFNMSQFANGIIDKRHTYGDDGIMELI